MTEKNDLSTWTIALFLNEFFDKNTLNNVSYNEKRIAIMNKIDEFETIENDYKNEVFKCQLTSIVIDRYPKLTAYFSMLRDRTSYNIIMKDLETIAKSTEVSDLVADLKKNLRLP